MTITTCAPMPAASLADIVTGNHGSDTPSCGVQSLGARANMEETVQSALALIARAAPPMGEGVVVQLDELLRQTENASPEIAARIIEGSLDLIREAAAELLRQYAGEMTRTPNWPKDSDRFNAIVTALTVLTERAAASGPGADKLVHAIAHRTSEHTPPGNTFFQRAFVEAADRHGPALRNALIQEALDSGDIRQSGEYKMQMELCGWLRFAFDYCESVPVPGTELHIAAALASNREGEAALANTRSLLTMAKGGPGGAVTRHLLSSAGQDQMGAIISYLGARAHSAQEPVSISTFNGAHHIDKSYDQIAFDAVTANLIDVVGQIKIDDPTGMSEQGQANVRRSIQFIASRIADAMIRGFNQHGNIGRFTEFAHAVSRDPTRDASLLEAIRTELKDRGFNLL